MPATVAAGAPGRRVADAAAHSTIADILALWLSDLHIDCRVVTKYPVLTSLASHHYPSSMQEHDIHASNKQGPEVLPPIATTP
jgi:hypothetical protein